MPPALVWVEFGYPPTLVFNLSFGALRSLVWFKYVWLQKRIPAGLYLIPILN